MKWLDFLEKNKGDFSCTAILQLFLARSLNEEELVSDRNSLTLFTKGRLGHPAFANVGDEVTLVASEILKEITLNKSEKINES